MDFSGSRIRTTDRPQELRKISAFTMFRDADHLSQAEREKISERTKSGLIKARLAGQRLSAPKGNINRQGKTKDYDPKLVRQVLTLSKKGLSLRIVAELVTSDTAPISYQVVSRILKRHG